MGQQQSSETLSSKLATSNVHCDWEKRGRDTSFPNNLHPVSVKVKFKTYEPKTTSCVEEKKKTAVSFDLFRCHVTLNEDATVAELFQALKSSGLSLSSKKARMELEDDQTVVAALVAEETLILQTCRLQYHLQAPAEVPTEIKRGGTKYKRREGSRIHYPIYNPGEVQGVFVALDVLAHLPRLLPNAERKSVFCDDASLLGCLRYIQSERPFIEAVLHDNVEWVPELPSIRSDYTGRSEPLQSISAYFHLIDELADFFQTSLTKDREWRETNMDACRYVCRLIGFGCQLIYSAAAGFSWRGETQPKYYKECAQQLRLLDSAI